MLLLVHELRLGELWQANCPNFQVKCWMRCSTSLPRLRSPSILPKTNDAADVLPAISWSLRRPGPCPRKNRQHFPWPSRRLFGNLIRRQFEDLRTTNLRPIGFEKSKKKKLLHESYRSCELPEVQSQSYTEQENSDSCVSRWASMEQFFTKTRMPGRNP